MIQKTCQYCQTLFNASRSDMKFCSSSCRHKYKHRLNSYHKQLEQKQSDLIRLQSDLELAELKLNQHIESSDKKTKQERDQEEKYKNFKRTYNQMIKLPAQKLYDMICKVEIDKITDQSEKDQLKDIYRFASQEEKK
jgi:hypothetical protein